MPKVPAIEVCQKSFFDSEESLRKEYADDVVDKILRCRQMYLWLVANPEAPDKLFVAEHENRFHLSRVSAYDDLKVIKSLAPKIAESAREFHRWRYNEMILDTYKKAKSRNDTRTMERAATSYAKYNRIDLEEELQLPLDMIVVQPFIPTTDPSVLGIKPIPNLQKKISDLIQKYRADSLDIDDVDYEEADLQLDSLFPVIENNNDEKFST